MKQDTPDSHDWTLLSESQLAQRWQISIRTLQQSRWKGVGCSYIKIGRLVRYRLQDVEDYEANHQKLVTPLTMGEACHG